MKRKDILRKVLFFREGGKYIESDSVVENLVERFSYLREIFYGLESEVDYGLWEARGNTVFVLADIRSCRALLLSEGYQSLRYDVGDGVIVEVFAKGAVDTEELLSFNGYLSGVDFYFISEKVVVAKGVTVGTLDTKLKRRYLEEYEQYLDLKVGSIVRLDKIEDDREKQLWQYALEQGVNVVRTYPLLQVLEVERRMGNVVLRFRTKNELAIRKIKSAKNVTEVIGKLGDKLLLEVVSMEEV